MTTKNHKPKTSPQDKSPDVSKQDLKTTAPSAESKDSSLDLASPEGHQESNANTPNEDTSLDLSRTEGLESKSMADPDLLSPQESSQVASQEQGQENNPPDLSHTAYDLNQPNSDLPQPESDMAYQQLGYPFDSQSVGSQSVDSQSASGLPPLPPNFNYELSPHDPSYQRSRSSQDYPPLGGFAGGFKPNASPYKPQGQMGNFNQGQPSDNFNSGNLSGPVSYGPQQGQQSEFYPPNQPHPNPVSPYSNRHGYPPLGQGAQWQQGPYHAPKASPYATPNFPPNPHGNASDLPFLVRSADGHIMMRSPQDAGFQGGGAQPYSFNQGKEVEKNPQSPYYVPYAHSPYAMPQRPDHMQQGAEDSNGWIGQPGLGDAYASGEYGRMPKIGDDPKPWPNEMGRMPKIGDGEPNEPSAVHKTPEEDALPWSSGIDEKLKTPVSGSGSSSLSKGKVNLSKDYAQSTSSSSTNNTNEATGDNSTHNTNEANGFNRFNTSQANNTMSAHNTSSAHNTNGQGGNGSVNPKGTGMWQVSGPSNLQTRGYVSPAQPPEKWYDSLGAHIILVAIISLLLLIPTSFFSWVLSDRESNQHYAIDSMTAAWGGKQYLADPELIIPVMEPSEIEVRGEGSRAPRGNLDHRFIRPKQAETVVNLVSEKRYKGNYEATLYTIEVVQSGYFDLEASMSLLEADSRITLISSDDIRVGFNIDDNKGIDEIKSIEINGRSYEPAPSDEFTGFEVLVPKDHIGLNNRLKFKAHFLVRGSQVFQFYPLAQVSELKISATGAVPNFTGSFLPREREVNTKERTFTANYYQNNLSTGQAMVSSSVLTASQSHISIELFDDADSYVLIDRLTKYVLLFIAMTYVTVLAFEIASKRLVSLVQYVVIGVALILFYLVLLSFSEHFSFVFSYVVAALTLSLMIALYIKAVFNSKKNAVCLFVMLLAMYAVLFAIVHIEAYALLVGTILLVIMLGVVMYITRHINQKPITRHYAEQNKA